MPYEVHVSDTVHACHAVRMPDGGMEPLHWHRWGIEAVFEGDELDDGGMLVDFLIVRDRLSEILDPLEGVNLNEHPFLDGAESSAELFARAIHDRLAARTWTPARLSRVLVREAPGCVAVFGI